MRSAPQPAGGAGLHAGTVIAPAVGMRSLPCVVIVALTPALTYAEQTSGGDRDEDDEQSPAEEYVEEGSLELGGSLGASIDENTTTITGSPSIGYFIADRVELSLSVAVSYTRVEDDVTGDADSTTTASLIFEPSYHHPVGDYVLLAAGLGVGTGYDGDDFDFEIIPSIGVEIMTSRSNIITPTLRMPIIIGQSPGADDDISTNVGLAFDVGISTTW